MNYSIENLEEVADCNILLSWAAKEKADLEHKKYNEEHMVNKIATTSEEIEAALQGVNIELNALDTVIAALSDGPAREDSLNKKVRLEYKKFLLEAREENYGPIGLLQKEMELSNVLLGIDEMNRFIASVNDHKARLESQS